MCEDTKKYNGHTYSGVLLEACANGYRQGITDALDKLVNAFTEIDSDEFAMFSLGYIREMAEQLKGAEQ